MLCELHIRNLALIREEEISFGRGLNILSGETGAGKSILLGALGFALGGRVPKDILRSDEEDGLAEAIFHVEDEELLAELKAQDIPLDEDNPADLILSRRIRDGRSVARINGETVPAGVLAKTGARLLSVYGQNESQSLMHEQSQMAILDGYAGDEMAALRETLSETWKAFKACEKEWQEATADESMRLRETSFLEHEIAEIEEAALREGEDEELSARFRLLSHAQRLSEAAGEAQDALGEEASAQIARALRCLEPVREYDPAVQAIYDALMEADALFSDVTRDLSAYVRDAEYDPQEMDELQKRLDLILDLKAKYGQTIAAVLDALEQKKKRLAILCDFDAYKNGLKAKLDAAQKDFEDACKKATALRKSKGAAFEKELIKALSELNFLDVRFECRVEEAQPGPAGADHVVFYISTNPGEPLRPLSAVASGGELSRIMLAVKTVQAKQGEIDTLIFDEIDAGISGATASAVARRLKEAAAYQQVICITHLPQIAAKADVHFLISKEVHNERTESRVRRLTEEETLQELARMLGGDVLSDTVLANARELKNAR